MEKQSHKVYNLGTRDLENLKMQGIWTQTLETVLHPVGKFITPPGPLVEERLDFGIVQSPTLRKGG